MKIEEKEKLEILKIVECIAKEAHGEQKLKYTGLPYITHPISVSQRVSVYVGGNLEMEAAALLHDVLEDTNMTYAGLLAELVGIPVLPLTSATHIHVLVNELTDVYTKENYPCKNRKERKSLEAKRLGWISIGAKIIKYFDLENNAESIEKFDPGFYKLFKEEAKIVIDNLKINSPDIAKLDFHMRLFKDEP